MMDGRRFPLQRLMEHFILKRYEILHKLLMPQPYIYILIYIIHTVDKESNRTIKV